MTAIAPAADDDRGPGRTLVLVHSHPFDRSMWPPQLEQLSDKFRVVAPDLPGYGSSPVRHDPMPMRGFADATVEVRDRLGVARAVIVGLSMGELVALEVGLGYPERVDARLGGDDGRAGR